MKPTAPRSEAPAIPSSTLQQHVAAVSIDATPRGYQLTTRQRFAEPREQLFAFFGDAGNLAAMTPAYLHFRILTPLPIRMQTGTLIDYRLRLRRIPIRWRTRIRAWEPPHRFIDEQLRGPYRFWHHQHQFVTLEDGTTEMTDVVDYGVTCGAVVHPLWVSGELKRIFAFRRATLAERFLTA